MVGQNVGNYRITKLLAEGGMGAVYLAEHPGLGRRAAVKVLDTALARDRTMIDRFFNEAKAANAIGHPGIVEIWDFGVLPGGTAYIVMEYLAGESLADRLKRVRRLSLAEAGAIVDQLATALGAAHAQGIVHRDLKPDNVFLLGEGRVKILDFGIAKLAQRPGYFDDVRTRTGALLGTPQYMSPEQCRDASDVDHRTDVYSLGVVLYEMLVGRPPFSSPSWGELVHMHLGVMPPAPRTLAPDLPEGVEQVITRALEKDPAARFQSMAALQAATRAALQAPTRAATQAATQAAINDASVRTLVLPEAAAVDDAPRVGGTLRLETQTTQTTMSGAAVSLDRASPVAARRPRWVAPVLAAGALGGVFLVVVLIGGGGSSRPVERPRTIEAPAASDPASSAPAAAVAESKPAPPSPAREITVDLVTDPAGAAVIRARDGATLGATPLTLTWAAATGSESLRLERAGYRSEQVEVPLDHDLTARLHLEKVGVPAEAGASPERHARVAPRSSARSAPEIAPPGRRAPERNGSPAPAPVKPAPARPAQVAPPGHREPLRAPLREPLKI